MGYGESIRTARKAAGLTQAQLAEKCNMATITIQQYERGKREPRSDALFKIAKALNISVLYFTRDDISFEMATRDVLAYKQEQTIDNAIMIILEAMYGKCRSKTIKGTVMGRDISSDISFYETDEKVFSLPETAFYAISYAVQGVIAGIVDALAIDIGTAIKDEIESITKIESLVSEEDVESTNE